MLFDYSVDEFERRFEQRLGEMLSPDELGAFVLVLANSMQDASLQQRLAPALEQTWQALLQRSQQGELKGPRDDVNVFHAIEKTGIQSYHQWEPREASPWHLAFNPLRALRPERGSKNAFAGLQAAFNEDAFHFDKPFLKPEILSEELFGTKELTVLYHKFPFIPYHLLLVPENAAHLPQFLDKAMHELLWAVTMKAAGNLNGFGLAYNSLGAGASINHLHAHGFIQEALLPVENTEWCHCGGKTEYPINCYQLTSIEDSWAIIHSLHQHSHPYNLLYRPGKVFIIPRKHQGHESLAPWLQSGGWYEVCGGFNLSDQPTFERLDADTITGDMRRFHL